MIRGARQRPGRFRFQVEAIAAALLALAPQATAKNYNYSGHEVNQQDSFGYGSNNYWNGSGDSKDEGVRNGMRALNRLASLDIGGAIHYGYKGYGNYTNSQKMDDLDSRAWKLKGVMSSVGDSTVSGSSGGRASNGGDIQSQLGPEKERAKLPENSGRTISGGSDIRGPSKTFGEMDRGFLYRGETSEVAAEFERRSGMSRETFFNHLASAADSGLSWDDPDLMQKFEARYQAFVKAIPNEQYRKNIEKVHSMFSLAKKQQVMNEMREFYVKNRWGEGGAPEPVADSSLSGGQNLAAQLPAAGPGAGDASGREPASLEAAAQEGAAAKAEEKEPQLTKEQMGMYLGLEGSHGAELNEIMSAALTGADDSIFKVVSRRYKKLTPSLVGKAL